MVTSFVVISVIGFPSLWGLQVVICFLLHRMCYFSIAIFPYLMIVYDSYLQFLFLFGLCFLVQHTEFNILHKYSPFKYLFFSFDHNDLWQPSHLTPTDESLSKENPTTFVRPWTISTSELLWYLHDLRLLNIRNSLIEIHYNKNEIIFIHLMI